MKINFCGQPNNFAIVNHFVSRSAQPEKDDFFWLKEQGVTDIINFRTRPNFGIDFDEKSVVESLGLKYHNIPSYTRHPNKENIYLFLNIINEIEKTNGKAHIHCKAGADRTGMYAFILKQMKNIGTLQENIQEWLNLGHHRNLFPNLIEQTQELLTKIKK